METFSDSSLVLVPSMETLVPLSWPFFSIYNSNDKLEQRHLVFVFNKNHNASTLTIGEKLFPELRDRPSILGKGPSPKKRSILGAKTPRKCTKFFSWLPNIYKIYILQKKWSNSTNPFLSSDPNNLLPLIGGCHHQLDDQHKEPMVNTKIIYLGN